MPDRKQMHKSRIMQLGIVKYNDQYNRKYIVHQNQKTTYKSPAHDLVSFVVERESHNQEQLILGSSQTAHAIGQPEWWPQVEQVLAECECEVWDSHIPGPRVATHRTTNNSNSNKKHSPSRRSRDCPSGERLEGCSRRTSPRRRPGRTGARRRWGRRRGPARPDPSLRRPRSKSERLIRRGEELLRCRKQTTSEGNRSTLTANISGF